MENAVEQLKNLLPNFDEIKDILKHSAEAEYIVKKTLDVLACQVKGSDEMEECSFLIQALIDKSWEEIHTGQFSLVPLEVRKTYSLACYCKSMEKPQIEKCSQILDEAMLIGCKHNLFVNCEKLTNTLTEMFDNELDPTLDIQLPVLDKAPRRLVTCDILQLDCPSVEEFNEKCFRPLLPTLLLNTIQHWHAIDKWLNLNYILKLAGNRTVPIEIGSNYTTEEWSQQMMKIKDFLKRQFGSTDVVPANIEYLAQHELFEQIPQLKKDISIPDYCSLGNHTEAVDIKAWLGPKGTISPMHYDPKHNLLCQVFGSKRIILASPNDSEYLYPHTGEFLSNTSQIDAASLDFDKFPLLTNVKFYKLTLQPGDCLYMPPKWWHFVESESPSFSVSFWWE